MSIFLKDNIVYIHIHPVTYFPTVIQGVIYVDTMDNNREVCNRLHMVEIKS